MFVKIYKTEKKMKSVNRKVARGYRLKPETHEILLEVKQAVKGDIDYAITAACKKFLNEIRTKKIKEK